VNVAQGIRHIDKMKAEWIVFSASCNGTAWLIDGGHSSGNSCKVSHDI